MTGVVERDAMRPIPLIDLQAQYRSLKAEIDPAIQDVLDRAQFILGPEVHAFEREMAAYCGAPHAVAVASGTDALALSLRALGIGPGDEVLTTAYSFFATAEAIVAVGAVPVFIDIELSTYNLDPEQLEAAVTPKTKAILPVHLFGHPCDMDAVQRVARAHRLAVIEDCAQAIGARFQGRRVGSLGDAAAFSFFPSKNLGGYGDGGMVVTHNTAVAEQVRLLRAHGSREKYHHLTLGTNSRLDELQAAILRVKLRHLDRWTQARRVHAAAYAARFARLGLSDVILPEELPGCEAVYHLYSIRTPDRDRVRQTLAARGIATQVCYPSSLPAQPALAHLGLRRSFPRADQAAKEILALPMYPELTEGLLDRITGEVAAARPGR